MSRRRSKSRRETGLELATEKTTRDLKLLAILAACVCIAVAAVHWKALSAEAITFDDNQYFTENPLVQKPSLTSAERFLSEVLKPSTVDGYYQPVTMISLMLDYALGGRADNLRPVHRTSLILHVTNTALIIVLIYLLFGAAWPAAAAGLLFGLHPMTVETIAWVGERKTLLATFFSLWSFIFYVRFAKGHGLKFYFGCLATYILALMSKPTSLPLPMLMVLLDYWPLRRLSRQTIVEKAPLFAVGGVWAMITIASQGSTASLVTPARYGASRVVLTICHNIIFYPAKMLWPANLSPQYIFPEPMSLSNPAVFFGVVGTIILIALLVISLKWTRGAVTGWLFFFIAILPTMQVLQFSNAIASDKFAYLPSIGLLAALAAFGCRFCVAEDSKKSKRCVVMLLVLMLGVAETVATERYLRCWRNTICLYEHMLSLTPDSPPLHYDIANALIANGRTEEAVNHYQRALAYELETPMAIPPNFYIDAHFNLANTLKAEGKFDEAVYHYNQTIGYYRQAMLVRPDKQRITLKLAKALINLGNVYSEQGKSNEAINCYRGAIVFDPDSVNAYSNMGWELKTAGNFDEALACFRKALGLNPEAVPVLVGMAEVLAENPDAQKRHPQDALGFALWAAELTGYREIPVLETLAEAYAAAGRFDKAAETMQKALELAVSSRDDVTAGRIREQLKQYQSAKPVSH